MLVVAFWAVTPSSPVGCYHFSEGHAVSVVRVEVRLEAVCYSETSGPIDQTARCCNTEGVRVLGTTATNGLGQC
jgi:hypothetical protein